MCPDPHVLAIIHTRGALSSLSRYLSSIANRNTSISADTLRKVAALVQRLEILQRRLDGCAECSSRKRATLHLKWVQREAAELVAGLFEMLSRMLSVALLLLRRSIDAVGRSRAIFAGRGGDVSTGLGEVARHFRFVHVAY